MEKNDDNPILNQVLSPEFLEQFKDSGELNIFMEKLYISAMELKIEGEFEKFMGYSKHSSTGRNSGNSRNGKTSKRVKTIVGEVELQIPRDRKSSFEPALVSKHSRILESIEEIVISLYARGMSVRDIENQIRDIYRYNISDSTILKITSKVQNHFKEWQNRPLDPLYFVIWMDGIDFKVKEDNKLVQKTIYLAVGLSPNGHKKVLGMWMAYDETKAFWVDILSDLKRRGVNDILLLSTDDLQGIPEAIKEVFPQSKSQICIIHQIRNSTRHISWKDRREFAADMKPIYTADSIEEAVVGLDRLEKIWIEKYPRAVKSWRKNWTKLSPFYHFPKEIRKMIYTTNVIENLNGNIRKYTKSKNFYSDGESVKKAVYLALREITRKWTKPILNWDQLVTVFEQTFGERANNIR